MNYKVNSANAPFLVHHVTTLVLKNKKITNCGLVGSIIDEKNKISQLFYKQISLHLKIRHIH